MLSTGCSAASGSSLWAYALGALTLTIANAILKPILAILTLPLIIFTLGIAYFGINILMLALAEWVAPNFSIDASEYTVGATIVVWLVNIAMQGLLALMTGGDGRTSSLEKV